LFGLAGMLPASYTTPIMSGQGLAGTFAALSMICALASKYAPATPPSPLHYDTTHPLLKHTHHTLTPPRSQL